MSGTPPTDDTPQHVGDEDLHAFVDGRLDDGRRLRVAHYLAANPDQQQRVRDWTEQGEGLRRALRANEGVERDLILARLAGVRARRSAAFGKTWWATMAASVVLALCLGGLGGWVARGNRNPTEIARLGIEAATAYHVFANDTDRPIEISSDNRADLVAWMTQKLGRRVTVPNLAPMGYHLMGGRVLTAMYGPAAMLLYQNNDGDRMTVYLQPMRIGLPEPMRPVRTQAVDGYAWIDRQIGYTVMSDGNREQLHKVADQVRADAHL